MDNEFYHAFEEKFRGSRSLIKKRLSFYLPLISVYMKEDLKPKALDLGCGRGEWLEILSKQGFDAIGVDTDEGMLNECRENNLNAVQDDILNFLKSTPDNHYWIVSAFHVFEHLDFELMWQVISEVHRVLKPGGIVIIETPNSENLIVASSSFYMDPTHIKPLNSSLLSFCLNKIGFLKNKLIRLNTILGDFEKIGAFELFYGVSPDYALISQKKGILSGQQSIDNFFSIEYGVSLECLLKRYDENFENFIKDQNGKHNNALIHFSELKNKLSAVENKLSAVENKLSAVENKLSVVENKLSVENKIHYIVYIKIRRSVGSILRKIFPVLKRNLGKSDFIKRNVLFFFRKNPSVHQFVLRFLPVKDTEDIKVINSVDNLVSVKIINAATLMEEIEGGVFFLDIKK